MSINLIDKCVFKFCNGNIVDNLQFNDNWNNVQQFCIVFIVGNIGKFIDVHMKHFENWPLVHCHNFGQMWSYFKKDIFFSKSMDYLACKPISSWSKVLYSYLWPLQRKNKHDLCLNERVTVQMEKKFLNLLECPKQYISSLDDLFWFLKHKSFTNYIILRLLW